MKTVADYLAKIPPLHSADSRFMAELALVLQPFVDAQAFLTSLPQAFDLDYAIGVQLDATGAWIGQSREIPVPVLNPWFSLDTPGLGADQGYWKGPYEGTALASLDDDTYRRLLRAIVAANNSDGTQPSIQACLREYLPIAGLDVGIGDFAIGESPIGLADTYVFVIDTTDYPAGNWSQANLSMAIGISGALPSIVDLSILAQGVIPVQPAATQINWAVTTVSGYPVFGFDVENEYIGGLDNGAIGADPAFVIENVILS